MISIFFNELFITINFLNSTNSIEALLCSITETPTSSEDGLKYFIKNIFQPTPLSACDKINDLHLLLSPPN